MNEKLQQLVDKLKVERDEFQAQHADQVNKWHSEWATAEDKWVAWQERLREAGLNWAEKAGKAIDNVENELQELKQEASDAAWKLNFKAHHELHDMGEDVDQLEHKLSDAVRDTRIEVTEELHELGEEIATLYAKLRARFRA